MEILYTIGLRLRMDNHLLLELAHMFYKNRASIIHGECGLMETLGKLYLFYPSGEW